MPGRYPDRIKQLIPFDGRFDAFQLNAEGCKVLFASYPAGTEINPHTHDTDNYGVITRGKLILLTDGKRQCYGVGDWYHVPAYKEHAAKFEQETDEIEFWFSAALKAE